MTEDKKTEDRDDSLDVRFTLATTNGDVVYLTKGGQFYTPDEHREAAKPKEDE